MDSRHSVRLPSEFVRRSEQYGAALAKTYADGLSPRSRSVSSHGAESNVELLAVSKMGECAFALWAGVDPDKAVSWRTEFDGDGDADVVAPSGLRCDVKTPVLRTARALCWPIRKNRFFDSKNFDVLVLVLHEFPERPTFYVSGWIPKAEFAHRHHVANAGHRLTTGTWYLDLHELATPHELARIIAAHPKHFTPRCHCGKWACFGYGVHLRAGQEGVWYCRDHRPDAPTAPEPRGFVIFERPGYELMDVTRDAPNA